MRYFGLETEKTATMGKNRYVVTDSTTCRTKLKIISSYDYNGSPNQGPSSNDTGRPQCASNYSSSPSLVVTQATLPTLAGTSPFRREEEKQLSHAYTDSVR